MKTNVHSIRFDADEKLIRFVENKLSKVHKHFDNIISSDVFLRVSNSKNDQNKISEIKINLPGKEFFVKKQSRTFEEATDLAVDALRKQINRYRKK